MSTIISNEAGEVLFVREAKPIHRGMWNLPGGHVELGEHPTQAAIREVKEETGLDISLSALCSIYSGISPSIQSIRFTFDAGSYCGSAVSGDEVLEIAWMHPQELLRESDAVLVGAKFLRRILEEWMKGARYPLDLLREM